ncbi:signal recognition particle-docking protein FtsY [Romboutsia sp. 13368]|uniref:signal recognition particle-docking protein FtsY n=1 Tax=Romboutsia sp. 13368 TaxID=2708053 RepID=UPI0025D72B01|nr:signal recognition particle-docking protein FtsY [Romboutsia sp. 13368]
MLKKLFKFGKKNQEEVQSNEVVNEQEVINEANNKDTSKENEKVETNENQQLQENTSEEIDEENSNDENENVHNEVVEETTIEELHVDEVYEDKDTKETAMSLENMNKQEDKVEEDIKEEIENQDVEKLDDIISSNEVDELNVDEEENSSVENTVEENNEIEEPKKKVNLFERLKQGLTKAKQGITDRIDDVLKSYTKVDEELLEELEEILITADVGVNTTMDIIDRLREKIKDNKITEPQGVKEELKNIIEEILTNENSNLNVEKSPTIILMVGVNGVGKTTTIGKLANRYKQEGKKVLLAAGDTFRAAAIEQLEVWAGRSNVDIIKHQEGADPGAVVFDAIKAAKARKVDLLICDTAGRLHNKANLMNELGKVFKIVDREFPEANKEVLLVVDATTGQNAVVQAKTFKEVADITGIVLTKLDGTAKGGVVLAVKSEVDVPVKLIGVGEKVEDLQDFDAKAFSDALFGSN